MRVKCRFFAAVVIFFVSRVPADWPAGDAVMTRSFGFNDRGRPALGVIFECRGDVPAAGGGEIIFSRSWGETASRLPSPLGAWTAVDHGDGLVSVYSRYLDEPRNRQLTQVDRGDSVAIAGASGWSRRDGFHYILFDRKERRWVNPAMVIDPFPQVSLPQIQGIQLRNAQGRPVEGAQIRNLSQGRYTVAVNASDPVQVSGGRQYSPYRIVCSVNGAEAGTFSLETISARDGILMVNRDGLVPALQVYGPYPAYEVGDVFLSRGQAILEVIIQDITGNSRNALTRILVE